MGLLRFSGWFIGVMFVVWLGAGCKRPVDDSAGVLAALERGRDFRERHLYSRAEEVFLELLRQHPDSAAAHQELGYLYFENLGDYVSALYHLKRFGAMDDQSRTNSTIRGDVLEQVQLICKQEIAKEIALGGLLSGHEFEEMERLTAANKDLREKLERVSEALEAEKARSAGLEVAVSEAQRGGGSGVRTAEVPEGSGRVPEREVVPEGGGGSARLGGASGGGGGELVQREVPGTGGMQRGLVEPARPASIQYYTVRKGDTFYNLAKRAGLSVAELQRLNPEVRPSSLQIGQRLKIPQR
ncbi:MAG: LysM domain [Verrucomicrobiota bacterium]|jgi:tetratricopeptide (TPR) repeat protein